MKIIIFEILLAFLSLVNGNNLYVFEIIYNLKILHVLE